MMLQRPGVFDALSFDCSFDAKDIIGGTRAVLLAAFAGALAYKADSDPPT
jgi:hypothetical protein